MVGSVVGRAAEVIVLLEGVAAAGRVGTAMGDCSMRNNIMLVNLSAFVYCGFRSIIGLRVWNTSVQGRCRQVGGCRNM